MNHVKRRRWLLAVSLGWLACAPAQDELTAYFLAHGAQDPAVAAEDAYKYLYHAARGGEHALADETAAGLWLAREWATLGPPQPGEELWEPLTADGRIGRLHLRPYKAQGGNKEALLDAFLAGARDFDGHAGSFRQAWRALGRVLQAQPVGQLTFAEWQRVDRAMKSKGYPAAHHSVGYTEARAPAYRVLPAAQARRLLEQLPEPVTISAP